jgi:hypothetical protein
VSGIRLSAARPLLINDIRARMRFGGAASALVANVVVMAFAAALTLATSTDGPDATGVALARLTAVELLLLAFLTPATTLDTIRQERRRGTWDILVAGTWPALSILGGKLLAALTYGLLLLASALPPIASVAALGTVSPMAALLLLALAVAAVVADSCLTLAATVALPRSLPWAYALALGAQIPLALIVAYGNPSAGQEGELVAGMLILAAGGLAVAAARLRPRPRPLRPRDARP